MGIPQVIWLVLMALSLGVNAAWHGKKLNEYNFWSALLGFAVQVSLLSWGGFCR